MYRTADKDLFLYPLPVAPRSHEKEGVPREQKTSKKIALSSRQIHVWKAMG